MKYPKFFRLLPAVTMILFGFGNYPLIKNQLMLQGTLKFVTNQLVSLFYNRFFKVVHKYKQYIIFFSELGCNTKVAKGLFSPVKRGQSGVSFTPSNAKRIREALTNLPSSAPSKFSDITKWLKRRGK